jgi:radical SAM protein with 4Fe4S-binding SPASM domain
MNDLYLLAINLTQRCNLACDHCYLDATTRKEGCSEELSSQEVCNLLDSIAERGNETMVVLTGGEPLMRPDLEIIARHGANLGLAMVLGTNGTLLTEKRINSLKQAGMLGVGISVDSLKAARHDNFRGRRGCWDKTMAAIRSCKRLEFPFQIHFTVTQKNHQELPAMILFCCNQGARVLNVFFLVCTGRGESLVDISPRAYERVLEQLVRAQADYPELIIRPRCAPQFKRVAHQLNPEATVNRISGRDGDGCIAATHYCRVTPKGEVTPCPYIDTAAGSIRQQDFWEIWDHSPDFVELRHPKLQGKCGLCEYRELCGGCRARAIAEGKSITDEDPGCDYQPQAVTVIQPWQPIENTITWSEEAEARLGRVPGFIRKMVRKKAEAYVQEKGEVLITCEHLNEMTARRFGNRKPYHPGSQ